jgi:hypothetical protein
LRKLLHRSTRTTDRTPLEKAVRPVLIMTVRRRLSWKSKWPYKKMADFQLLERVRT